jgi:hypothetical protein
MLPIESEAKTAVVGSGTAATLDSGGRVPTFRCQTRKSFPSTSPSASASPVAAVAPLAKP